MVSHEFKRHHAEINIEMTKAFLDASKSQNVITRPAFTCLKLTKETLEQDLKYVQC